MGEESPDGKHYTLEQNVLTAQALLLLTRRLSLAPTARLSVADLKEWHQELTAPLGIRAGEWRTGDITFGSYYGFAVPEIAEAVSSTFQRANEHLYYVDYLDEPQRLEELVRVSAYVHGRLIRIHPFEDGNGRVSRLVLSAMFWAAELDLPDLTSLTRTRYISALNVYKHKGTDDLYCPALEPLQQLILELL